MRLSKMRIKNYRCFKDQEIFFDRYTCFVGTNGSGKSTVLMALNIFFRNAGAPTDVFSLQEEDFHDKDTSECIDISCTFNDLSEDAKRDLKAYVRQNELTVTARAKWSELTSRAEVVQIGVRKSIKDFQKYFDALDTPSIKVKDLKEIYQELLVSYPQLRRVSTKDDMTEALREFEELSPNLCEDIESQNQFYGWSRGANLLGKYVQWVYLPAVKDPADEQDEQRNSALGTLLQRTIRIDVDFTEPLESLRQRANEEYKTIVESKNSALIDLQGRIEEQLKEWSHPGARLELNWHSDDHKSVQVNEPFVRAKVGEGGFLGEIVRSGHGMQRSFLVSLLQVLANTNENEGSILILGFEEPELYQHPPQAKHLAALLERLAFGRTQVVVTTHSPYFVSSRGYENIRYVKPPNDDSGSKVNQLKYQQLCDRLAEALGEPPQQPTELMAAVEQIMQPSLAELFFCKVPVLVEGREDVAFISTYLHKKHLWEEFRKLGCHFVACDGKTNMSRPLAISQGIGMRPFVIFDADIDKCTGDKKDREFRDNICLSKLQGFSFDQNVSSNVIGDNYVMWRTRILDEIRLQVGGQLWDEQERLSRDRFGLNSGVKQKNPLLIAATVELLFDNKIPIPLLEEVTEKLLAFSGDAK